jgi:hypothetical protein
MNQKNKNKNWEDVMKFTLDTQLGALLDHPQAKPIIEKYLPGISTNPMVGLVKGMTLNALLATPQAAQFGITKEKVESVLVEINKVVK